MGSALSRFSSTVPVPRTSRQGTADGIGTEPPGRMHAPSHYGVHPGGALQPPNDGGPPCSSRREPVANHGEASSKSVRDRRAIQALMSLVAREEGLPMPFMTLPDLSPAVRCRVLLAASRYLCEGNGSMSPSFDVAPTECGTLLVSLRSSYNDSESFDHATVLPGWVESDPSTVNGAFVRDVCVHIGSPWLPVGGVTGDTLDSHSGSTCDPPSLADGVMLDRAGDDDDRDSQTEGSDGWADASEARAHNTGSGLVAEDGPESSERQDSPDERERKGRLSYPQSREAEAKVKGNGNGKRKRHEDLDVPHEGGGDTRIEIVHACGHEERDGIAEGGYEDRGTHECSLGDCIGDRDEAIGCWAEKGEASDDKRKDKNRKKKKAKRERKKKRRRLERDGVFGDYL